MRAPPTSRRPRMWRLPPPREEAIYLAAAGGGGRGGGTRHVGAADAEYAAADAAAGTDAADATADAAADATADAAADAAADATADAAAGTGAAAAPPRGRTGDLRILTLGVFVERCFLCVVLSRLTSYAPRTRAHFTQRRTRTQNNTIPNASVSHISSAHNMTRERPYDLFFAGQTLGLVFLSLNKFTLSRPVPRRLAPATVVVQLKIAPG